jgi:hypothetical protein
MEAQNARDAERYRLLRDYLLLNGFVNYQPIEAEAAPFVMDVDFYGHTFEEAVDALAANRPGFGCVANT